MRALVFPGQGSQFPGMGKDLYNTIPLAKELFERANDILGFDIAGLIFEGSESDLKQTKVTQPAVYLHSIISFRTLAEKESFDMMAGHSLGEFTALTAAGVFSFEDGLRLVSKRALAMQKACDAKESGMAAIIGLDDALVEKICNEIDEIVVPANYNSPGQIVISGTIKGIDIAIEKLKLLGAKRAVKLVVGGAFHSPLMEIAKNDLEDAIKEIEFKKPVCPVYQNVNARATTSPEKIRKNLIEQLTSAVRWTQTIRNMISDGADEFIESGPGNVLQGLIKRINNNVLAKTLQ